MNEHLHTPRPRTIDITKSDIGLKYVVNNCWKFEYDIDSEIICGMLYFYF